MPETSYMKLYTVAEMAEMLKVSQNTIRNWIKEGKLSAQKLPDGKYRIREADVNQVLKDN